MRLLPTIGLAVAALSLVVAACDTDVSNPGPVQDEFLADTAAFPALLNGAGRAVAEGINWVAYTGASVAREIHPAGSTGSFGITPSWQQGILSADDADLDVHWEQAQQARWVAEQAAGRMEEKSARATLLAQVYLYAGYANRLLGENMCQAVINGSGALPSTDFLTRAEEWFSKAAQVGMGDVQTAAFAGRASVRVSLGTWAEAVADAGQVPTSFSYAIPYFDTGDNDQRNRIHWASANRPYRAHTQWNTVYEQYFRDTQDPRVAWTETELTGDAALECCDRVPWYPQQKYPTPASAVRMSSGREMRLIEAESQLLSGNWQQALVTINALRTETGVPEWTAASEAEAWAHLKRERGIELWLEGRRLGDLRRWAEGNTPGELDPLEIPGPASHLTAQDRCFPISLSERQTNPNFTS